MGRTGLNLSSWSAALTQRVAVERAFWFCFQLVKCREKFINAFFNNQNTPRNASRADSSIWASACLADFKASNALANNSFF